MHHHLATVELRAFVPARDFEVSKDFYQALGFTLAWSDEQLAYFHHGTARFLLQNFYDATLANNFMMHLVVEDVAAWHAHIEQSGLAGRFNVKVTPVEQQPWGMCDFVIYDPSGVLWRIGQETD